MTDFDQSPFGGKKRPAQPHWKNYIFERRHKSDKKFLRSFITGMLFTNGIREPRLTMSKNYHGHECDHDFCTQVFAI